MIAEIIALVLRLIADWPKRREAAEKKDYAQWRNGEELRKDKRASRALDLLKLRDNSKGKLP